ncbi:UDP-N-acetylmuramoyl-tripeptide--D-alanyl-D-alanine ligase [Rivibacter subsaxonicus]|uniref:UDP-N-acetylmuramoyl-tripeptide--D-alanyl-D-alanine ligase n=1 Tax=Rivibacter subsaxonicus TaxID=457575 RepID=A0A4Q7VG06_9BURK|nr:Mur ligase family protein [Rivibacter subsaxonicus]RZT94943.1 UDP-N-acetylmuramoyl-tripeptide--D-alanyl-D-alanine ligase [Rivibacter subsaxonicus]
MSTTMMTLADAHAMLPGSTLVGDDATAGATAIARVHSDTRSLQPGDLFVALRGERFDAHDFLAQARAAGAVAALVQRADALPAAMPGLVVADSKRALGQLAAAWRQKMELPLIAVTGSNGKTTVTQMIASILRAWHGSDAFATEGNLNNDIGVPLTLLRLRPHHRAGVVELGMNHPGEIAELAVITRPTVALVNNAQREHQEFMATVEAVARENGSVFAALPPHGVAVFPADDAAHTPIWQALAAGRPTLSFALQAEGGAAPISVAHADIRGEATWHVGRPDGGITAPGPGDRRGHWALLLRTPAGEAPIALRVPGRHNVLNAMAAASCALAAGAPWAAVMRGLESFQAVKGRSQLKVATLHGQSITLIDDSYNANPDSVRAAIDVLAGLPGPRWLLLGDMGEVGNQGPAFHAEVGVHARERGIENFWCAGAACAHAADAFGRGARRFADAAALVAALGQLNADAPRAASVLVKGSRFMKMEQVVAALALAPATPTIH